MYPTIDDITYISFPQFINGGVLIPFEFENIPFIPKRIFQVFDVPSWEVRGQHSRKTTTQLLICTAGKIHSTIKDMYGGSDMKILNPGEGVLVKKFLWDSQKYFSRDSILLVFCDTSYNKKDYIEDWDEFLSYKEK